MQRSDTILQQAAPTLIQAFHGRCHMSAGRWIGPRSLPHWTISYCPGDGLDVELAAPGGGRHRFRRRAKQWQLNPPGTAVYSYCHDARPFAVGSWVVFDLDPSSGVLPGRDYTAYADPDERIGDLVVRMHEAQQRGERGSEVLLTGLLCTVIGELAVAVHRGAAGDQDDPHLIRVPGSEGLLARVDRVVLADIARSLSVQDIADRLHCSVSTLGHRFREETGMTVVQRLRWLRVCEARRLLAKGELGVKAIAARLGFSSPSYFGRVFKEVVGMTPAGFRRQLL